jgi:hypothetical protein
MRMVFIARLELFSVKREQERINNGQAIVVPIQEAIRTRTAERGGAV